MEERLRKLKDTLGVEWGELANRLCISRAMLGFVRRGDKAASSKLLKRISDLELSCHGNQVLEPSLDCNQVATLLAEAASERAALAARLDRLEKILLDVLARLPPRGDLTREKG